MIAGAAPLLLATLLGSSPAEEPALRLPWVFADHMVFQRERALPVWGEAHPTDEAPLAPLFPGQAFHGSPHESQIHASILRVAELEGLPVVDLATPLRGHADWFPDHLHPDARASAAIAEVIRDALVELELPAPVPPR